MSDHSRDDFLFDVRLQERHLMRGIITRDALQKRQADAQDMAEHADILDLDKMAQTVMRKGRGGRGGHRR